MGVSREGDGGRDQRNESVASTDEVERVAGDLQDGPNLCPWPDVTAPGLPARFAEQSADA